MNLVEFARDTIRERGFISAMELVSLLTTHICEHELVDKSIRTKTVMDIIEQLKSDEIHQVEYANKATESFRRKDLFYYNPDEFFHDGKREEYIDNTEG